jgi:salicylate hydroxylase
MENDDYNDLYEGRRSATPLKVIIVGGGITGLATAFALQKAGHPTLVLDRNPADAVVAGGGRAIPPNAVKILAEWGIGEELMTDGVVVESVDFRHRKNFFIIHQKLNQNS